VTTPRHASGHRVAITAIGHHAPPDVRDNQYFTERLNTTDDWIISRTGVRERRVLIDGGTSDLAIAAARRCLAMRGIEADDVDCIIVATITPDHVVPSTAAIIQHKLGASQAWGFDLSAACSAFPYALTVGASLVTAGVAHRVLVCAADKMTTLTNYDDRSTAILFGDAAAAVLLEPTSDPDLGIMDLECRLDGSGVEHLWVPAGGSARPASAETVAARDHYLVVDGPAVFKAAVEGMAATANNLMARNGLTPDSVDWLVPHQANLRIIEAVGRRLGFAREKVMVNVDRYGNTTAASIPLCLSEWHECGRLRQGDDVILVSFGAGYTMGGVYLRWSIPSRRLQTDRHERSTREELRHPLTARL
jgi:3-oxoacyl-[acyl-carrier-protein] synthase-3